MFQSDLSRIAPRIQASHKHQSEEKSGPAFDSDFLNTFKGCQRGRVI